MLSVISYGCVTSAGNGVRPFFIGLREGMEHCSIFPRDRSNWDGPFPRAFLWKDSNRSSVRSLLSEKLLVAWEEVMKDVKESKLSRLGVIFASSKGCIEDFIWNPKESELSHDPLSPVLKTFLEKAHLNPLRSICVSNACASFHSAVFLASSWLSSDVVSHALILSADYVGSFVVRGFHSLKALSETGVRPFSATRDGLLLGEAATAVLLAKADREYPIQLGKVGLQNEGFAVTRHSLSGKGLTRAISDARADLADQPNVIIAHGTATRANDEMEDAVLGKCFPDVPITASKWSVGHTLGASGSVDFIAACEMLLNKSVFPIATTKSIDANFIGKYLHSGCSFSAPDSLDNVLVTSLGFGGVNAALGIRRAK